MSQFADAVLVSPGEEEIKISADAGIKSPGVNACADRSSKKGRSFSFQAASDTGNVEYKRCLLSEDFERIDSLTTQLAFRLHEGGSQALSRNRGDPEGRGFIPRKLLHSSLKSQCK